MDIKKTLLPGQDGTRELVEEYGERLICIRQWHDKLRHKRIKTVEIIVEESEWTGESSRENDNQVLVRIETNENVVREQIEAVGGTWNADKNAWQMNYRKALQIGVEKGIIH